MMSGFCRSSYICDWTSENGPSWHKKTISQNGKYLEVCVQYLPSVNCETLAIKLWFDGENFTSIALADD